jgi:hypothetical protein
MLLSVAPIEPDRAWAREVRSASCAVLGVFDEDEEVDEEEGAWEGARSGGWDIVVLRWCGSLMGMVMVLHVDSRRQAPVRSGGDGGWC